MVNVRDKVCIFKGCKTRPNYNKPGKTRAIYCTNHKKEDMVDVKHKTCAHEGCMTRAYYNNPGEKRGSYCTKHKLEGMVDVKNKTCAYEGCTTLPNYNRPSESKPLYCVRHREEDMVDVKNKVCEFGTCGTLASYGLLYNRATHCAKHKTNNEYLRVQRPKCGECSSIAYYTDKELPVRCEVHKKPEDKIISLKKCTSCELDFHMPEDKTQCNDCNPPAKKIRKRKRQAAEDSATVTKKTRSELE
jgi:EsV-1-7 cysteine-rich motif